MLLIGIFAAALFFVTPAKADPISIALITAVAGSAAATATAVAVTTFVLTTVASMAISFVAQALLKPPARSGAGASSGGSAPVVDNKVTIRQAAATRPIVYGKTRGAGIYAFVQAEPNNIHLNLVILFAGHEIEAFDEIWLNDQAVSLSEFGLVLDGPFAGKVGINKHLGAAEQVADTSLIANSGGTWTAADRLQGIAYLYVRLEWDARVFASGIPNITAVMRGKNDIYDPRTDTTGYSNNAALCLANYLCDETYGVPVDYATGIDETALIAAANACDEDVDLAAGGTETRYTANGILQSSAEPQENIGLLLAAMHGKVPYDGETWKIIAGVYQTPAITLTDDDLRAGPRIQTLTSRRDMFNAVKGTFVGAANSWQEADFPPIESAAYAARDGQTLWKDMALPLTSAASRAQRIAKIDLLRARQQIAASMPCKLSAWRVQAGDTVMWTSERYGWTAKPFEVRRARFAISESPTGPTLGVDLDLIEVAASDYDWSTDEESTVDAAPNTDFPNPFTVLPTTNLAVAEELYDTTEGGGVKVAVILTCTASPDAFAEQYQFEYKLRSASDWTVLPRVRAVEAAATSRVEDIKAGAYDWRVAAVNVMGVLSPYEAIVKEISGLGAPPQPLTGLSLANLGGLGLLRWTQSPDRDVRRGGTILVRHAGTGTSGAYSESVTIADPVPGDATQVLVPLKAGTYLLMPVDSSGNPGTAPTSIESNQATVLAYSPLATQQEDPTFAGAKSSVFRDPDDGKLKLAGLTLVDDFPDWDAVSDIDFAGGVAASGTYTFGTGIDLGSVKRCRLTTDLVSLIVNEIDLIDDWTGNVDDRANWDGTAGADADVVIEFRETDDNPAGAPVWSDWNRLDVSERQARAFQFRARLSRSDSAYNIHISELAVTAAEVV